MAGSLTQRSFAAGELSPDLGARADQVKFQTGLSTCRNFIVMRHGGVTNRQGSQYMRPVRDEAVRTYLLPFIFNSEQTYLMELGEGYIRFYRNGGLIVVPSADAWLEDTRYEQGALVENAGGAFYCFLGHQSSLSATPSAWATATAYTVGQLRSRSSVNYRCIQAHTSFDATATVQWADATAYTAGNKRFNGGQLFNCLSNHTSSPDDEPGVGADWTFLWDAIDDTTPGAGAAHLSYWVVVPASSNEPGVGVDYLLYWLPLDVEGDSGSFIYQIKAPYTPAELSEVKWSQSGDVLTLTHRNHPDMELRRTGHTAWTLVAGTRAPAIGAPQSVTNSGTQSGNQVNFWVVTAVTADGQESVQSAVTSSSDALATQTVTVFWEPVAGAVTYHVYRKVRGLFCFLGETADFHFEDDDVTPNTDQRPFENRDPFPSPGNYPAVSAYYQQRKLFANTINDPEVIEGSRVGSYHDHTRSTPLQDDDAITFRIAGNQVNEVRHLVPLKRLLVLTENGEWIIRGDADGALTPATIFPDLESGNGASTVNPMVIGDAVVFLQARGHIVRDLRFVVAAEAFSGRDLSIFSSHLFEQYTIERTAYAKNPHSIGYMVRSDGTLIGLTYLPEQEIWGWHRHDTAGWFEDVCVLPEGNEDVLYAIVRRVISGATRRYVERFPSRVIADIRADARFLDSHLTYDGRNTESGTMLVTETGGGGFATDALLTVIRSSGTFTTNDVGNAVVFFDDDGVEIFRAVISAWADDVTVNAYGNKDVPVALRGVERQQWALAVDQVANLLHLEGEVVGVLADGNVVFDGDPDAENAEDFTVTDGVLTLAQPAYLIHVGQPITADIETLEMDTAGAEIRNKLKKIADVALLLKDSRGGKVASVGKDLSGARVLGRFFDLLPDQPASYEMPVRLFTGQRSANISDNWNEGGRFILRQTDPLPITVLGAIPTGEVGG